MLLQSAYIEHSHYYLILVSLQTEGGGEEDEGGGGGGGVGPTVSRLVDTEEKLAEEEKTVFDWCKEGRQDLLRSHLTPDNINNRDSEVG